MSAAEPLSSPATHVPSLPTQRPPSVRPRVPWVAVTPEPDPLDFSTPRVRHHVSRREIAWALTVSLLLTVGIVGTLLLRTAMQGEARVVQQERQQMAALQQQADDLERALARQADPALLARRARALHMHPQNRPAFVRAPAR